MCTQKQETKEASHEDDVVVINIEDIEEFEPPPPFLPGDGEDEDGGDIEGDTE